VREGPAEVVPGLYAGTLTIEGLRRVFERAKELAGVSGGCQ